jgi:tetratricopeptide (TPR) repeat protein
MPDAHREDIEKLESLYAENPEGRIFTHLAEAYRKAGELDRATEVLEAGIERHPEYSSAHVVYGRVLRDLGKPEEARRAFRRVLELDPHNLVAIRALGDLARSAGQQDDALGYYNQILEMEPADEEVRSIVDSMAGEGAGDVPVESAAEPWTEPAFEAPTETGGETPGDEEAADQPEPWTGPEEPSPFQEAEWTAPASQEGMTEDAGAPSEAEPWTGPEESADETPEWWPPAQEPAAGAAEEAEPGEGLDWSGATPYGLPEPGEEEGPPSVPPGVMTETIAQVYARQGLYDRAAEVYRELVRERPDDDSLRAKLEEMERLAEPPAPLETTHFQPTDVDVAPLAGLESDDVDASTGLSLDSFPAHVPDDMAGLLSGEAAEPPDEAEPGEPDSVWMAEDWGVPEEAANATPYAWAEPEPETEDDSPPIQSYFSAILGWRAGQEPVAEEPADELEAGTAPVELEAETPAGELEAGTPPEAPEGEPEPWAEPWSESAPEPEGEPEPWAEPWSEPAPEPESEPELAADVALGADADLEATEAPEGDEEELPEWRLEWVDERAAEAEPAPEPGTETEGEAPAAADQEAPVEAGQGAPAEAGQEAPAEAVAEAAADGEPEGGGEQGYGPEGETGSDEGLATGSIMEEEARPAEARPDEPPTAAEAGDGDPGEEEDDDLDTFRSWLESLKP